jgi:hypothetical protein
MGHVKCVLGWIGTDMERISPKNIMSHVIRFYTTAYAKTISDQQFARVTCLNSSSVNQQIPFHFYQRQKRNESGEKMWRMKDGAKLLRYFDETMEQQ